MSVTPHPSWLKRLLQPARAQAALQARLRQEHDVADMKARLAAIDKVQAVIEFKLDGTILVANDNFLNTLGYQLEEIQGKHHSMFAEPAYAASAEYRHFWAKLNQIGRASCRERVCSTV